MKNKERGSSLLEVLVAFTILAIGLLGVMSMQTRGLNSNQRAFFVTEATLLADDMASRILAYGNASANAGEFGGVSTAGDNSCAPNCTPVQAEAAAWDVAVEASNLPSIQGDVSWEAADVSYTITIKWDEENTGAIGGDCNSDARDADNNLINLTCFQLEVAL